jgi:hypothetical protein
MSTIINGTSSAITFPDSSVQNTSAIVSGYVPYANLPAGSVLQVVQGTTTTGVTISAGGGFTATNLSASITPKYSTSKVLVMINGTMYVSAGTGEPQGTIYRNGSNIGNFFTDLFSASGALVGGASATYLDSPATTSATTYAFYFRNTTAGNATFPVNSSTATIVLMEIAA